MKQIDLTDSQKAYIRKLDSSPEGLSTVEVHKRVLQYGKNVLVEKKKKHVLMTFFSKFTNPLVLILLFASLISVFSGEFIEFFIIFSIILVSVLIETYQEHQSEMAAEKLKQKVAVQVDVIRDGVLKEVTPSHLTVGDLIMLSTGAVVPADLKIVKARDLHVDESTLNGESFPAEKNDFDELYMGSTVMNGEAVAIVMKIGQNTQFGKIAESLNQRRPESDFEKGIRKFGNLVMKVTITLVLAIFVVNFVFKHDVLQSFLFALALAVGLTPELLPVIITVNLAKGAMRMSKKGVIVKHLPSIQNFGSMDVLCTDKTGTITENKIELEIYENIHEKDDKKVLEYAYLNSYFQSNLKNPLDEAVLSHEEVSRHSFKKVDEIPFDFIRKRLSIVCEKGHEKILICKGAPEGVLALCKRYEADGDVKVMDDGTREKLNKRYDDLSKDGFRALVVAYKPLSDKKDTYTKHDENDLIFLGYIAFLDPPKKEIKDVLETLFKDGVTLKILTGDSELVTQKVCSELNIPITGVVVGKDLLHVTEEALIPLALKANIFARLTPDQKSRIIAALKRAGHVVGYMGDGVNDATSLRTADIGISVNNAVDVAKESADIILLTKSLKVLKNGIYEGRKTFSNTMKYIFMGMGSNFGNMFSVSFTSLFLSFLPLLPVHILLNNLIYDISQLTLSADDVDEEDVQRPAKWDMKFIKRFMYIFGPVSSLFDFMTFGFLLLVMKAQIPMFRTGWFIESLVTQSLVILVVRTRRVPFFRSKPAIFLVISSFCAAALGIVITQTPLGKPFQFTLMPISYWVFLVSLVVLYLIVVDIAKLWFYRKSFSTK